MISLFYNCKYVLFFFKHFHSSLTVHVRLDDTKRDLEEIEREKTDLEEQLIELQKRVSEHEVREYEATLKVRYEKKQTIKIARNSICSVLQISSFIIYTQYPIWKINCFMWNVLQVRGSVQMVENALLEKDEAIVREKQAKDEIERLQKALSKLVDEAGVRTRKEVKLLEKQLVIYNRIC